LKITPGAVIEETPAARRQRERLERLEAAERALQKDEVVNTLLTEFDGRLDDVQPLEPAVQINQETRR
jgi:hypothetical protein